MGKERLLYCFRSRITKFHRLSQECWQGKLLWSPGTCSFVELPVVQSLSCVQLFCGLMDCSPPGSSVHGILQARILEWAAISSSRGASRTRDRTRFSCIGGRILYHWATWEAVCRAGPSGKKRTGATDRVSDRESQKSRSGAGSPWVPLSHTTASHMDRGTFHEHMYPFLSEAPQHREVG